MFGTGTFNVKIFADCATFSEMLGLNQIPFIRGYTTNPTLMYKAGVRDYEAFAHDVLMAIPDKPVSFEVFGDAPLDMERQARKIASWGENVYVKIPVTTTYGDSTHKLVRDLTNDGIKVNVTAMMTPMQVERMLPAVVGGAPCYFSIFAGRIADTGVDPTRIMERCLKLTDQVSTVELIWASTRELLNIIQADVCGVHIITVGNEILSKLPLLGKNLNDYSRETILQFHQDGQKCGFSF